MAAEEIAIGTLDVNGTKVRWYSWGSTTLWLSAGVNTANSPQMWMRFDLDHMHSRGWINLNDTAQFKSLMEEIADLKQKVKVLTEQRNKAKMAEELRREEQVPTPATLAEKLNAVVDILKS